MPKPRASRPSELLDMGSRALREFEEAERRRYHERIRAELIQRGAIVDTQAVEKLLEEAAPRFREKGWRVTQGDDDGA